MIDTKAILNRKSVRSYTGEALTEPERAQVAQWIAEASNPFGIPIDFRLLDAASQNLTSPVLVGARTYIAGKLRQVANAEAAFGYSFEHILLSAYGAGLGGVWIAGTMDRPAFERAMEVRPGEVMPAVSPLGHPAQKRSLRETMMRKGVKADTRQDFGALFFDGSFDTPLTPERAGALADALELVRWAPSAVNKQPWRVVLADGAAHFYEQPGKGYASASGWDIQKVDLGIALYHFTAGLSAKGVEAAFRTEQPAIASPEGAQYIGSFIFQ